LRASIVADGTSSVATVNDLTYGIIKRFLLQPELLSGAARPGKATTIAFVNANSLKRAQSGEQPSNTSGAAASALIPTRRQRAIARDGESLMARKRPA
jgi:hypothetical protein